MDKQLIFAVAGSGKTTKIIQSTRSQKRSLIITYTKENARNITTSLLDEHGNPPDNIIVMTYFSFLYKFCFRPFHSYRLRDQSFTWELPIYGQTPPQKSVLGHYMTKERYLYSNRVAKYLIEENTVPKIIARLEEFFDCLCIDEVQDFAANDFNFILDISKAKLKVLYVGDFFQHTYDTSRDGNIKKNLHKKGVSSYLDFFKKNSFQIDLESLDKTYRCTPDVCKFISDNLDITISSHRSDRSKVEVVTDPKRAVELYFDNRKVKLFFQESTKYDCYSNNWGKSKGLNDYHDICVVLNGKTQKCFENNDFGSLPKSTINKLYVACSRAFGDLYILNEKHLESYKQ